MADGVKLFADAFDKLNGALAEKRARVLGKTLNDQTMRCPAARQKRSAKRPRTGAQRASIRRLWNEDAALWTGSDEGDWLGWLDVD